MTDPLQVIRRHRPMRQDNMRRQLERLERELRALIEAAPASRVDRVHDGTHEARVLTLVTLRAIAALWSDPSR